MSYSATHQMRKIVICSTTSFKPVYNKMLDNYSIIAFCDQVFSSILMRIMTLLKVTSPTRRMCMEDFVTFRLPTEDTSKHEIAVVIVGTRSCWHSCAVFVHL